MNEDVQFKKNRLMAIAQGFIPPEEMAELIAVSECKEIERGRKQFKKMVLGKEERTVERKSRDEQPFVNKTQFILMREHEAYWDHLLPDLLADQTTLFSRSYQVYATDHPFYLELRRQQGNTSATQIQACINEALFEAPNEKKECYARILRSIAEKAEQENKTLPEVEQEMLDAAINQKVKDQVLEDLISWIEKSVKADDVLNELKNISPNWEFTQQETEHLLRGYLRACREVNSGKYWIFQQICTYGTPIGMEHARKWLGDYIPNLELREEDMQAFISGVLKIFFYRARSLPLEKEAAGHYSARYWVCDKTAFLAYQKRKEYLEKALKKYEKWSVEEELIKASELPDPIVDLMGTSDKKMQICVPEGKIAEATREYLSFTRGGAKHFDVDLAQEVIRQTTVVAGNKIDCLPMLYLMVCVTGSSQLFATSRSVKKRAIQAMLKRPYHRKPAEWQQRIWRIDFLNNLHELCGLDRNQRAVSWQCFLQIHGSDIQSSEEADLWWKVIYGDKNDFNHSEEDIPPIELSLLCSEFLQTCLPIQPEYMYGYQGGSILHLGGFARFLQKYPDVLPDCIQRIKQRPERWEKIQKNYLKQWSMIPCDLLEVKNQCCQGSKLIRWGTISNASQEELSRFCQSLHKDNEADEKQIASDVEELKMLLTEMALRTVLTDRARQVLADKIEKAWSKDSNFKFRVSFPKRSRTEEL